MKANFHNFSISKRRTKAVEGTWNLEERKSFQLLSMETLNWHNWCGQIDFWSTNLFTTHVKCRQASSSKYLKGFRFWLWSGATCKREQFLIRNQLKPWNCYDRQSVWPPAVQQALIGLNLIQKLPSNRPQTSQTKGKHKILNDVGWNVILPLNITWCLIALASHEHKPTTKVSRQREIKQIHQMQNGKHANKLVNNSKRRTPVVWGAIKRVSSLTTTTTANTLRCSVSWERSARIEREEEKKSFPRRSVNENFAFVSVWFLSSSDTVWKAIGKRKKAKDNSLGYEIKILNFPWSRTRRKAFDISLNNRHRMRGNWPTRVPDVHFVSRGGKIRTESEITLW